MSSHAPQLFSESLGERAVRTRVCPKCKAQLCQDGTEKEGERKEKRRVREGEEERERKDPGADTLEEITTKTKSKLY